LNKLILITLTLFFFGCSNNGTSPSNSGSDCNSEYAGIWELTESGRYENANCTGERISSESSSSSSFTLSEHGSYTTLGGFCSGDENDNPDFCSGGWTCSSTTVTIESFWSVNYIFDDDDKTTMTTTTEVTQMPDTVDEYDECQYSTYTKLTLNEE